METILSIVVLVLGFILFIHFQDKPTEKDISESEQREKARIAEKVRFGIKKEIFKQFSNYINDLFSQNSEYYDYILLEKFSVDFPHYKSGNSQQLLTDLLVAELIQYQDHRTKVLMKGQAFENLLLSFPIVVNFLKNNPNYTSDEGFGFEAKNIYIKRIINSNNEKFYFHFGVAKGDSFLKEFNLKTESMLKKSSVYLYATTFKLSDLPTGNNTYGGGRILLRKKVLIHYDYGWLEKECSSSEYQKLLDKWFENSRLKILIQ